ncbi:MULTISPECIES: hypothetical protein, partial [Brucella]|uniref:hypothetical protein n=1 Tax=Brucella TaxID=234 RepID=UPI0019D6EEEA
ERISDESLMAGFSVFVLTTSGIWPQSHAIGRSRNSTLSPACFRSALTFAGKKHPSSGTRPKLAVGFR